VLILFALACPAFSSGTANHNPAWTWAGLICGLGALLAGLLWLGLLAREGAFNPVAHRRPLIVFGLMVAVMIALLAFSL
jgi:hypothetical protein